MRHKKIQKALFIIGISLMLVIVVFSIYSLIQYRISTVSYSARLDVTDLMQTEDLEGVSIFRGIAAFKTYLETIKTTDPPYSTDELPINISISIHKVYHNKSYDVSNIYLNISMYDSETDRFIINQTIYQEGFKYWVPPPTNNQTNILWNNSGFWINSTQPWWNNTFEEDNFYPSQPEDRDYVFIIPTQHILTILFLSLLILLFYLISHEWDYLLTLKRDLI